VATGSLAAAAAAVAAAAIAAAAAVTITAAIVASLEGAYLQSRAQAQVAHGLQRRLAAQRAHVAAAPPCRHYDAGMENRGNASELGAIGTARVLPPPDKRA
jgi:hypothetical protein